MTQTPAPAGPFAQHPRLSEVVNGLRFERYALFLSGLVYKEQGGPLRRAIVVATREGDLVAVERGEVFRYAGRVPTSRLFDDESFAEESESARREALADLNEAFFARDVAAWTAGRRSVNEVGIKVLRHWFAPQTVSTPIIRSEVLGIVPIEPSNGLLDILREPRAAVCRQPGPAPQRASPRPAPARPGQRRDPRRAGAALRRHPGVPELPPGGGVPGGRPRRQRRGPLPRVHLGQGAAAQPVA